MRLSANELRTIYQQTVIIRRPTYGIVSGYHELPYVCLGHGAAEGFRTTRVQGKIQVSPRFIIRPPQYEPSYAEIFGEEHVDAGLSGRIFGYLGFKDKLIECKSDFLNVEHSKDSIDVVLSQTMDDLERREDITTGVIVTPNPRYFPVSVERFISSVLDDEFRV